MDCESVLSFEYCVHQGIAFRVGGVFYCIFLLSSFYFFLFRVFIYEKRPVHSMLVCLLACLKEKLYIIDNKPRGWLTHLVLILLARQPSLLVVFPSRPGSWDIVIA